MPVATVGNEVSENSTINGKIYSNNNPIIPAGFKAINVTTKGHESYWDKEGGPQVSKGLVISDGTSEFVWIPVEGGILPSVSGREPDVVTGVNPSDTVDSADGGKYDALPAYLNLAACTKDLNKDDKIDVKDYRIQLNNDFNAMSASIKKYGGFYVGRYEVSIGSGKNAQSKAGEMPATASPTSANTWYGLYALCKTYKNNSCQGYMIWGGQYEAIINFVGTEETTKDGRVKHDLTEAYRTGGTNYKGEYNDIIKNIYDLEGNVLEWTQEAAYSENRVVRSGYYGKNNPINFRNGEYPSYNGENYGSRLVLCLE